MTNPPSQSIIKEESTQGHLKQPEEFKEYVSELQKVITNGEMLSKSICTHHTIVLRNSDSLTKAYSIKQSDFIYELNKPIEISNFNMNPNQVCSEGIHFFGNLNDALQFGIGFTCMKTDVHMIESK